MNVSLFENLIRQTITHNWYVNLAALALCLLAAFNLFFYYRKLSKQMEQTKKKTELKMLTRRRDKILLSIVLGLIATPYFLIAPTIWSYRAKQDISQQQYIRAKAFFACDAINTRGDFTNGEVEIVIDGEKIQLTLPYDWTAEEFPNEDCYVDVYYSKESKIILSVEKIGES